MGKYVTMIRRCVWCNPPHELSRSQVWVNDDRTPDPCYTDGMCPESSAQFEREAREDAERRKEGRR